MCTQTLLIPHDYVYLEYACLMYMMTHEVISRCLPFYESNNQKDLMVILMAACSWHAALCSNRYVSTVKETKFQIKGVYNHIHKHPYLSCPTGGSVGGPAIVTHVTLLTHQLQTVLCVVWGGLCKRKFKP